MSSFFPFFATYYPVVMDAVAVFAAFDTYFLARRSEAIDRSDRPIVAAIKKTPNKACHPTTMSGGVCFCIGVDCAHSGGCTFAFCINSDAFEFLLIPELSISPNFRQQQIFKKVKIKPFCWHRQYGQTVTNRNGFKLATEY